LAGGEDYFLLCTISKEEVKKITEDFLKEFNRPLYIIGEITELKNYTIVEPNGKEKEVSPSGWDHFKKG